MVLAQLLLDPADQLVALGIDGILRACLPKPLRRRQVEKLPALPVALGLQRPACPACRRGAGRPSRARRVTVNPAPVCRGGVKGWIRRILAISLGVMVSS